jgi:hypothetical protein
MITKEQKKLILNSMADLLEIPESAYEKAKKRYDDLGEWFGRNESLVEGNDPHIFPQGSFRLGTAIRPLNEDEAYDLDLSCKLRKGISKYSHTQENLKKLVGQELESYRIARGIKAPIEEKHRCWRLDYQDDLSFHMDIVPCIPADETKRKAILESMMKSGASEFIASSASQLTVSITDDRHEEYKQICENWNISNPEGYAKWFEYRMTQFPQTVQLEKAQVDDVPLFKRKSPLQRSIQLLKRHRDQMFKGYEDIKPISIIITTLAARAYNGELDIEPALAGILSKIGNLVNSQPPKVPNPVDPEEDFADRWGMLKYRHLKLEQNFWDWLKQAQIDFEKITSTTDTKFITEQAEQKFSVRFNISELSKRLGLSQATVSIVTPPKSYSITAPAKPWAKN